MRFLKLKFLLPLIVGVLPIPVAYACSLAPGLGFLVAPPWVVDLDPDCTTEVDYGLFFLYIFIVLVAGVPLLFGIMKRLRLRSPMILSVTVAIMIVLGMVAVEVTRANNNLVAEERLLAMSADPDPLADITEELDECFPGRLRRTTIFYCSVDEFDTSNQSYWILGTGHRQCEQGLPIDPIPDPTSHTNPSKLLRLGDVLFVLASDSFPFPNLHDDHCEYNITIHYRETGENYFGHFPIKLSESRYDFTLTQPREGKPIAGMIYDNEEDRMFYIVTKMIY